MPTYERVQWDDDHSVNDPELDQHHKHLAEVANRILSLAERERVSVDDLLIALNELGNNIIYHFDREEEYLKELDLPEVTAHIAQHGRYREEIKNFIAQARAKQVASPKDGARALAKEIAEFASDWVRHHMMGNAGTEKFFAEKRKDRKDKRS